MQTTHNGHDYSGIGGLRPAHPCKTCGLSRIEANGASCRAEPERLAFLCNAVDAEQAQYRRHRHAGDWTTADWYLRWAEQHRRELDDLIAQGATIPAPNWYPARDL